ncbi:MAG: sigma-70 family RNA polymerase sigma factor [Candidatus Macondimonas sp.]
MPATDELVDWLARTALGDALAFERLYHATSPRLYAVALRLVRRRDWAEDILQECYVKIWHHAGDYRADVSAPLTWLTQIVRNRCLDWLRRPELETSLDTNSGSVLDTLADEGRGPLQELLAAGDASALGRCLNALEVRARELILLAYYRGLSHRELAHHLSLPLGSVKSWIRRGLVQLKGCLSP